MSLKILKLIGLLVVLPLLLAALGAWELHRAGNALAQLQDFQAVQAMGLLQDRGHDWRVAALRRELPAAVRINHVQHVLAWTVLGVALLAALIGAAALAATQWAGHRAMQSRDALLQVFSRGSRGLPFVLVGHALAMMAVFVAVLGYEGLAVWHAGRMSNGEVKLMLALIVVAGYCLYAMIRLLARLRAMLALFQPSPVVLLGQALSAAQAPAPALWQMVSGLAQRLGALPPDHIVASLTAGFYVTSSEVALQPEGRVLQGRTLHVPLLYLGLLSRDEIAAVVGHELAHFVGQDTEYSVRFLPIYDGASRSLGELAQAMQDSDSTQQWLMQPSLLLGSHFIERFDHAVNHWSRERELLADAAGARLAGNAAAASALVRISAIDPHLDAALAHQLNGDAPSPAGDDLPGWLLDQLQHCTLDMPEEAMALQLPHPTDTHPSTGERLRALQVAPAQAVANGTRPVLAAASSAMLDTWLAEPAPLRAQLGGQLLAYVAAEHAAYTQALQTQADAVSGEQVLHEGARLRGGLLMAVAAGLLAAALWTGWVLWFGPGAAQPNTGVLLGVGALMVAAAALIGWFALGFLLRAHRPALRLTLDAFEFANLQAPLPIAHIADVGVQVGRGVTVMLALTDEAPLPLLRGAGLGVPAAKLNVRRRLLTLQTVQLCEDNKTVRPPDLLALLIDYVQAARARELLAQGRSPAPVVEAAVSD